MFVMVMVNGKKGVGFITKQCWSCGGSGGGGAVARGEKKTVGLRREEGECDKVIT